MENFINLIKKHKKAIIIPSVLLVVIAIITLFILVCLKYFDNLSQTSSVELNGLEITGAIEATSDDLLLVTLSSNTENITENSEEKKLEDEEKDKEEETKAEEEELKAEKEAKAKEEAEKKELKNKKTQETEKNKSQTTTATATGSSPYYIKINKLANTVTVYTKDANGNYTVPYKAIVCSTRICVSK